MVSKHQPTFKLILCYGTLSIAPCIAPQGGPNGVNHISMYLGYHNIEIKTRDILKLNFGIWNIVRFLAGFCVKYAVTRLLLTKFVYINSENHTQCVPIKSFYQKLLQNHLKPSKNLKFSQHLQKMGGKLLEFYLHYQWIF